MGSFALKIIPKWDTMGFMRKVGRMSGVLRLVLLMVLAVLFSGCDIQYKLLYLPGSPAPSGESLKIRGLKAWPGAGSYRGYVGIDKEKHTMGTVVVFHGNAGTAADRAYYVKALSLLGYRVVLAEYPVYGGRAGVLGEKAFVKDGCETVRLAFEQFGGPLFLLGESLGCGVAAGVSREISLRIDGIILITPWDTLKAVARAKFPYLPVGLFLKDRYDTIDNLRTFKGRIAVVGAERYELIPVGHALNLYDSVGGSAKQMWTIKSAGHNDWPMYIKGTWWKEMMDFVSGGDTKRQL
jgi:uncharacterized protein